MNDHEEGLDNRIKIYRDRHYIPSSWEARLHRLIAVAQEGIDEVIKDVFITNVRNIQANRGAKDLWLFSEHYAVDIQSFFAQTGFTILPLARNIRQLTIRPIDYVPFSGSYLESSTLLVEFTAGSVFELKAFAENCPILGDVLRRTILPNMRSHDPQ